MKKRMKPKQIAKFYSILNAAIDVFAEKGFHRTKISEIAKRAKVADGTIYLYFKNKSDLLMRSFENLMKEKLDEIKEELSTIPNELDRLRSFIHYHVELFSNKPNVARFFVVELRQSPEFYHQNPSFWPIRDYLAFIRKLCQDSVNSRCIRNIDVDALVTIIMGTIDFALTEWVLGTNARSLSEIENNILDIIQKGVHAEG